MGGRYKTFLSFRAARKYVRSLDLQNQKQWRRFCTGRLRVRIPSDIPKAPHSTYKELGWNGYGDWLGTGNVATRLRKYRSFAAAREFANGLGLKGKNQWKAYVGRRLRGFPRLPSDIPHAPHQVYEADWKSWGDWVGTEAIATFERQFRPFSDARAFARALRLGSYEEWVHYLRGQVPDRPPLPNDIPHYPEKFYKTMWRGYGDWLGNEESARYARLRRKRSKGKRFFITSRFAAKTSYGQN